MPGPFHFSQSTRLSISQPCENNSLMHGTCHSFTRTHTKITLCLLYADKFCFHFKKKWRGGLSTYWPTSNEKQAKMQNKNKKNDPGHLPQQWSICACPRTGSMSYVPQWLNEWTVAAWAISHNGSMKWTVSLPVSLMFLTLHVKDIAVVLDQNRKQGKKTTKKEKRRAE